MLSTIFSIIVLAIMIFCIFDVWTSAMSTVGKAIWTAILIILPLLGSIAWFVYAKIMHKAA